MVITPRGAFPACPARTQLKLELGFGSKQEEAANLLSSHDPKLQMRSAAHVHSLVNLWASCISNGGQVDWGSTWYLLRAVLRLSSQVPDLMPTTVHTVILKGQINLWKHEQAGQKLAAAISQHWSQLSVDAMAALALMISKCPGVCVVVWTSALFHLASSFDMIAVHLLIAYAGSLRTVTQDVHCCMLANRAAVLRLCSAS